MGVIKLLGVNTAHLANTGPEDRDVGNAEVFNSLFASVFYALWVKGFLVPCV